MAIKLLDGFSVEESNAFDLISSGNFSIPDKQSVSSYEENLISLKEQVKQGIFNWSTKKVYNIIGGFSDNEKQTFIEVDLESRNG